MSANQLELTQMPARSLLVLALVVSLLIPSAHALTVNTILPASNSTLTSTPTSIIITFDGDIDPTTVSAATCILERAGTDGVFDTADDIKLSPTGFVVDGPQVTLNLIGLQLPNDKYRVRLTSFKNTYFNSGLIAQWKCDEGTGTSLSDSSPNSDNGILVNNASWASGFRGSALKFDDTDGYVRIANIAAGAFGTGDFTAACWLKTNDSNFQVIGNRHSQYHSSFWTLRIRPNGVVQLEVDQDANGTNYNYAVGTIPINTGKWHHVTVTRTGVTLQVYVDGVLDVTSNGPGTANVSSNGYVYLGDNPEVGLNATEKYAGLLDEVQLYSRALTQSEIAEISAQAVTDVSGNALIAEFNSVFTLNALPPQIISLTPNSAIINETVNLTLTGDHLLTWSGSVPFRPTVSFDGIDDSFRVPSSSLLNSPNFTIEAWVKKGFQCIKRNGSPYLWEQFFLSASNGGRAVFWIAQNTVRYPLTSATPIGNDWTHLAATYDGTTQRIFINGVLDAQSTVNLTVQPWTEDMVLYAEPFWDNTHCNGSMSEFRFWKVARTQAQIAASMNLALSAGHPDLVVRYDFSNGGPNLVDTTGNGHTGTPQGNPSFGNNDPSPVDVRITNGIQSRNANGPLSSLPTSVVCTIDLTGLPVGKYDVQLLHFGVVVSTLPLAFTVLTPPPTVTASGPTTFCVGGSVTLNSSLANGNQWYLNGNPISGATNQSYVASVSGDYTVIDSVTPYTSESAATTVFVVDIPTPTITTDGPTTFCTGGSVTLTSSATSGNNWYFNGNPIVGATNRQYVATTSGDYTVVITSLGCSSSWSATTTVTVNPAPPTATIIPTGPTTFCDGGSVILISSMSSGNQWCLNGEPISGATAQFYVATIAGNYTVIVSASGCSSVESLTTTLTVNPIPATPNITAGGPTTFYAGGSVTLTSSVALGNQWYLDGNPIVGATSQQYVATASGDFTVVNTNLGCSSEASAATTVNALPAPLTVTNLAPVPNSTLSSAPNSVAITFSKDVDPLCVSGSSLRLIGRGLDGTFGTLDDVVIVPVAYTQPATNQIKLDLTGVSLSNDVYRVIARGNPYFGDLLAYWGFNENTGTAAGDLSGHSRNGILTAGAGWTTGKIGSAVTLDGVDDYVNLYSGNELSFTGDAPFTIAAWVKSTDSYGPIISFRNSTDDIPVLDLMVGYNGVNSVAGQLRALVRGQSGGAIQLNGTTINDGIWHHIALVREGQKLSLYLDGSLQANTTNPQVALPINTDQRAIGTDIRWNNTNQTDADRSFLNAAIDDVRVYARALNSNEVAALNSGKADIITDLSGDALDGEYSTTFPSGDNTAGGDFIADFTLAAPTITVTSPNGGERLSIAQTVSISWSTQNFTGMVELAYSLDNGANYSVIDTVPHTPGSYQWQVPTSARSSQCKIRVRSTTGTPLDESNAVFRIGRWMLEIPISGTYNVPSGVISTPPFAAATFAESSAVLRFAELTYTDYQIGGRNYDAMAIFHIVPVMDRFTYTCIAGAGQIARNTGGYPDLMTFFTRKDFDSGAFELSTPGEATYEINDRNPLNFNSDRTLYTRCHFNRGDGHPGPTISSIRVFAEIDCPTMPGASNLAARYMNGEVNLSWRVSPALAASSQLVYRASSAIGPWTLIGTINDNTTAGFIDNAPLSDASNYYKVTAQSSLGSGADSNIAAPQLTLIDLVPAPGAALSNVPTSIVANFSKNLDPATVTNRTVRLIRSGVDNLFGTPDDVIVSPSSITVAGNMVTIGLNPANLPNDAYRLQLVGSSTPTTTGLQAYWKLNEGSGTFIGDSSGNNRHGTLNGGTWTTGLVNASALMFADTGNVVNIGAADIPPPWTASMWVKRKDCVNASSRLMQGSNSALKLEQYLANRKVGITKLTVQDDAFNYVAPVNEWVHLAFSGTVTNTSFYVNGELLGTTALSINMPMGAISHAIESASATLSEIRVYNRNLSAAEISVLATPQTIKDTDGNALDGEPNAELPSGNGTAGGDFISTFTIAAPQLTLTDLVPAPGAALSNVPTNIVANFSKNVDPATVTNSTVRIIRAGVDTLFGTADDVIVNPSSITVAGTTLTIGLNTANLPNDSYQLQLIGGGTPTTTGLQAYWKLNEGSGTFIGDSSGNNRHGTLNGGTWTTGLVNASALMFADTGNVVNIGAADIAPPWTASMWVKRKDCVNASSRLMQGSSSALKLEQYLANRKVGVSIPTVQDNAFNYVAPVNEWVHLTFSGTVTNTSLYANGELLGTTALSINMPMGAISHAIESASATLSEIRVYNRNLSAAEINVLATPQTIKDTDGNALDGEPNAGFPSGNGTAGGDFIANFSLTVPPIITPSGPTTICTGDSVTLTSSVNSDNQWYLNGNLIGGATSQDYVATASGDYTVTALGNTSAATTVTVNPVPATPIISPAGPTTFCDGSSVTLTSSAATGNQWYVNGIPISGATNQSYVAATSGDYTVVDTTLGCSSAASAATTVTVNPIPATPTITPTGPTTFCTGGSVILISSSASGNQWHLNGNAINGATNQFYIATSSGDYTVNVLSASGCTSAESAATTVTVNAIPAAPTITPGGPTTFCDGSSVTLTSSAATGNQWYLNGNPIGGATNQTYIATGSGDYTVVDTALGCSSASSAATTVTVNPKPATPTITASGPITFCAGGSVILTSSAALGNQWFLNGNPIVGATSEQYVATTSGDYTVVDTALGCSSASSAATTVTVNPIPITPTITVDGSTAFQPGGSVTLTSSATTGNQWLLNGDPIVGASGQSFVATLSGSYAVINTSLGCSSDASESITVTVGTVSFISGPTATPTPAGVGQTVTFSVIAEDSNGAALTLTWDIAGTSISGATVQQIFTAPGTYTATVTAKNTFGLSSTSSVQVLVVAPAVGNGNDSDGDGFSDDFEISAGTNPLSAADSPTAGVLPTTAALVQSKLAIKLNFAKALDDKISFSGTLPIVNGFNPANQTLIVDVGGAVKAINLDAKGKSPTFKLSIKRKKGIVSAQTAKFSVKLIKGSFAPSFADEGLVDNDVNRLGASVLVRIVFNGVIYQATQPLTYSAKSGKFGSAKVPR